MGKMMQSCHGSMQKMQQANDQARQAIAAAKQSNDPAKMRAALDQAEKALTDMSDHMSTCRGMMSTMQNMHGMGMMGGRTPCM